MIPVRQAASPCLVVRRVGRELALALQEVEEIQEHGFGDKEQYVSRAFK